MPANDHTFDNCALLLPVVIESYWRTAVRLYLFFAAHRCIDIEKQKQQIFQGRKKNHTVDNSIVLKYLRQASGRGQSLEREQKKTQQVQARTPQHEKQL